MFVRQAARADLAFLETCEWPRGPLAYVQAGRNDVVVQAEAARDQPAASAKAK